MYNCIEEAQRLKDYTHVGDSVSFRTGWYTKIKRNNRKNDVVKTIVEETISGVVVAKYPHTFLLDNGHAYTWNQYLIGYKY